MEHRSSGISLDRVLRGRERVGEGERRRKRERENLLQLHSIVSYIFSSRKTFECVHACNNLQMLEVFTILMHTLLYDAAVFNTVSSSKDFPDGTKEYLSVLILNIKNVPTFKSLTIAILKVIYIRQSQQSSRYHY